MKEQNKDRFKEQLQQLPQYQAPKKAWQGIEWKLDRLQSEAVLQQSVKQLPQHQAPNDIWQNIDEQLSPTPQQTTIRRRMWVWANVAALAAVLIGLVLLVGQWTGTEEADQINYSYSIETIDEQLLVADWEEDETAFEMIMEYCKVQQIVCEEPEFKNLQDDLKELNAAREDLLLAMENYGKDAELVAQITRLEHERSDLLKQMLARI